jgi:hypothetical protein
MTKFVSGSNLTGHALIIFQNVTFLDSHPELSVQARKNCLFTIFRELYGGYGNGKYKDDIQTLRDKFRTFQDSCLVAMDGEQYYSPEINRLRNNIDDIELDLGKIIFELKILNEAKMGIVSEPTW